MCLKFCDFIRKVLLQFNILDLRSNNNTVNILIIGLSKIAAKMLKLLKELLNCHWYVSYWGQSLYGYTLSLFFSALFYPILWICVSFWNHNALTLRWVASVLDVPFFWFTFYQVSCYVGLRCVACPQNHHFPWIPTCLHWRQCEVVCHFQWVPAQVSACKPWISNACEEHPRLLSGAMLTHGSHSELTSWGCVGRIAELYPLSPPNATDARCFLPLHRQPCLHELCVPTLNGVLVRRIDLKLSPKVALNCDNRRCLCVFHSTKCLLLFGGRHLESFVPTGTAGISIKTRSI